MKQKIKKTSTTFSIRIDPARANKLAELAAAEGRSKGDVIKRLIDAAPLPNETK